MKGLLRARLAAAFLCLATLFSAVVAEVHAQDPYSRLHVGVGGGSDVGDGRFQEFWSRSPSFSMFGRMPFYVGHVEAGISASRHSFQGEAPPPSDDPAAPNNPLGDGADFWGALIHVGWGPSLAITPGFQAQGTLTVGDFLMVFDSPEKGYAQRENELVLGASAGFTFYMARRVGLFARLGYSRVFTSTPIDLVHVSAGLEARLVTPSWVREMLR